MFCSISLPSDLSPGAEPMERSLRLECGSAKRDIHSLPVTTLSLSQLQLLYPYSEKLL
jgi:hypothetical protein